MVSCLALKGLEFSLSQYLLVAEPRSFHRTGLSALLEMVVLQRPDFSLTDLLLVCYLSPRHRFNLELACVRSELECSPPQSQIFIQERCLAQLLVDY